MPAEESALAFHFSIFPYAFCFSLGIAAFRIRQRRGDNNSYSIHALIFAAVGMGVYLLFRPHLAGKVPQLFYISVLTFALVTFGSDSSRPYKAIFGGRLIQYLGLISYGMYLAHFPIVTWIARPLSPHSAAIFPITLALTIATATATYWLIEMPTRSLGRSFDQRKLVE